jgi:hypothetical protein
MKTIVDCCGCSEEIHKRKKYYYKGNYYCAECLGGEIIDGSEPRLKFLKNQEDKDNLFMGFELETESDDYQSDGIYANRLLQLLEKSGVAQYYFIKGDGSLDSGFELVSHPFLLKRGLEKLQFKKIFDWLKRNKFDCESSGNCGFHIHLNKSFFNKEDLLKMEAFFSLNQDYIFKLSGRSDKYNSFCQYNDFDLENYLHSDSSGGCEDDGERYHALNFSTGRQTIEIRAFGGTLDYKKFLAFLEFADVLSRFCKTFSLKTILQHGNSNRSWKQFTRWARYKKYNKLVLQLKKDKIFNDN